MLFLTSGHSDARGWESECPDVKNHKWWSCTGCFIAVSIWQQWESKGLKKIRLQNAKNSTVHTTFLCEFSDTEARLGRQQTQVNKDLRQPPHHRTINQPTRLSHVMFSVKTWYEEHATDEKKVSREFTDEEERQTQDHVGDRAQDWRFDRQTSITWSCLYVILHDPLVTGQSVLSTCKVLANFTFERKLSNEAYTLAQDSTCESQLSQKERVLFPKVFFRKRWAVIGQSETRHVTDWSFVVAKMCIVTESRILD